jgi:DNA mismatch repair protein MutS2
VDEQALEALEFGAIRARVAAAASTAYGIERAHALSPSSSRAEVERRQAVTAEAVALLDHAAEPPLHGIRDIRSAAERSGRGGVLLPEELAELGATVDGALRARQALAGAELAPLLAGVAETIDPQLVQLSDEIRRAVEDDGSDLRDTASPRLRRLRNELRAGRARVQEALERLARSSTLRPHLQETFIVQRGGRPVLAVKASSRSSVPGVVHDASESRQTLFVEPFEIVELNNRQSEAAAEERDEVERLLRELSGLVGARTDALSTLVDALGAIDLAVAVGTVSRSWHGAPVEIADGVRLLAVRHPLLEPSTAVPIDLELGDLRALVISGPNTGGKTVALKTLGLAVVLHQSGLRPPAVEAELPVFDGVLVEIGDQQSISMSLSTFAAHMRNLVAILETATSKSLVLVDELASGTDPVEGAALAQALLERLAQQVRLVVVTTHYAELKAWASAAEAAANAATAIDPVTHRPQYTLTLGRAGTSHALETAERLGLPDAVVAAAREAVAPEAQRIAELLSEAEAAERAAAEELAAAREARRDSERAAGEARRRESELAAEVDRVRASAEAERERAIAKAESELAAARTELAALRDEIREARRRQRQVERGRSDDAERVRDQHLGGASERAQATERALRSLRPVAPAGPLAVGDPVEAPGLGLRGVIVGVDGDEAEVAGSSGQRVRIALGRLRPAAPAEPTVAPQVRVNATAPTAARSEVDVRGLTAQEARDAVRAFVDDAAVAGLPDIRIVHGRGTGALKRAVRDELNAHPLVGGIRSTSADGATIADLG